MKLYINYKKINSTINSIKEEEIQKEIIKNINLKTKKYIIKPRGKNGRNI